MPPPPARSTRPARTPRPALLAAILATLAGCVPPPTPDTLAATTFGQIPGWRQDHLADTLPALRAGCRRLATLPADTTLGGAGPAAQAGGTAGLWSPACTAARALSPGDEPAIRRFYQTWFTPWRITTPSLVTGYYEPELRGSLAPTAAYRTPVLPRPTDLVVRPNPTDPHGPPTVGRLAAGNLVPYPTRAEITAGSTRQAATPIAWLASATDLFFLQIQGAGRIRLPDGAVIRLAYDSKNGRPYTPIGRVLVAQGALAADNVSMQSIRAWLDAHPAQAQAVMNRNEDYVFFRVLPPDAASAGPSGPPGALGIPLQPGRTAAVDRHAIPLGAPIFLDTTDPITHAPWQRLLLAQDVGSDITGAARTDVFLGAGDSAALAAGHMHEAGTEYLLLPRG